MDGLEVEFSGIKFANPLILPSGIIQEIADHKQAEKAGAGGVTLKSLTAEPRKGNPIPRVITYECGVLNSVGLINPGIKKGVDLVADFVKDSQIPVIASVFSTKVKEFVELVEKVAEAEPDIVELNLSCPNTIDELGESLGMGVVSTAQVVKEVREAVGVKVKLMAKLSPNVSDIGEVAKAAEAAGADAISAINTVGPGMVIDIKRRKPILGNKEGGVSGPGIRPIAIRCVYDIYEAVKIPILGMGGVGKWQDAVEMMMAGARLVGVGVAVYKGYEVFKKIKRGLVNYLKEQNIESLNTLVGVAH